VWFVAHPRVLRDWRGEPPNLYDISGSAHFINKADNGVVVHRVWPAKEPQGRGGGAGGARRGRAGEGAGEQQQEVPENAVQILVRKVRNKAVGRVGESVLLYDRATGRYSCAGQGVTLAQLAGRGGGVQKQLGGGGAGAGGRAAAPAPAGAAREMSSSWGGGAGAVVARVEAPEVNGQGEEEGAGSRHHDVAWQVRALGLDAERTEVQDLTLPREPEAADDGDGFGAGRGWGN
jgi:hypothetical protein